MRISKTSKNRKFINWFRAKYDSSAHSLLFNFQHDVYYMYVRYVFDLNTASVFKFYDPYEENV